MIDVTVGVSEPAIAALQQAGEPVPHPIKVRGLIDTGASCTVLQEGLAAQLGLTPIGVVPVNTPSTMGHQAAQYFARVVFAGGIAGQFVVTEMPLLGQNIQALIGRDVLAFGVLIYNGPANEFLLSI